MYSLNLQDMTTPPPTDTEVLVTVLSKGAWDYAGLRKSMGEDGFANFLKNKSGMTEEIQTQILEGHDFTKKNRDALVQA